MEELINDLKKELEKVVKVVPQISVPGDLSKGDLSTNVSLKSKNPMVTGERIVESLRKNKNLYEQFEKIELVKPGFINFYLSRGYISKQLDGLLSMENQIVPATKTIIFEFGDPNPFKEPHIGHVRNLVIGEAISRILEANSWKVSRLDYQGDVGMHVAKCLWGMENLGLKSDKLTPQDLSKAYVKGSKAYEENHESKAEIEEINKKIYKNDPSVLNLWKKGKQVSLDYFEELYKVLGVKYDKYYFESETAPVGLEIVEKNNKVFEKHDGAMVYRGENKGLHTRVFITSEGNPTYEAKDLGLAIMKDRDFPKVDKSIIMTANEQTEYFKVLFAALQDINPELAKKTSHLSFGFVNLKEGKMSSREGNVVPAFWLIEEVKKWVKKEFPRVQSTVLDDVVIAAVKWSMLKFSRESNISFEISESVQIEGNSGPYMLYTYARTASLLNKSKIKVDKAKVGDDLDGFLLALLRLVCQFEIIKKSAAESFSPNILCNYLFSLAQSFNQFYEKEKVIGSADEEEKLVVISAVSKVIKEGLQILGINTPEKI